MRSDGGSQLESGGYGDYDARNSSPVAEEGLFIQVPSCEFVSACLRVTANGGSMDIVRYNSADRGEGTGNSDDEGYLYGFAYFINTGCTTEGLLLTALSTFILFKTMRSIVLETVPQILSVLRSVRGRHLAERGVLGAASADGSAYVRAMWPLLDLVDGRSSICKTPINSQFYLPFERGSVSIVRPNDLHNPFIDVPLGVLCLSFSYEALRVIHSLLLQEERVVFIGVTPQHASACVISAQSLLVPFIWALPIVPYLPPDGFGVMEELWSSSPFILGSTADILPRLMLYGIETTKEDCTHIWIADARTGFVGVSPDHSHPFLHAPAELVPSSTKVEDAIKSLVSKEQRHMFREALGTAVLLAHAHSGSGSGTTFTAGSMARFFYFDTSLLEEVHEAYIEYNASRLLGNYRKGLSSLNNSCGSVVSGGVSAVPQQEFKVTFSLDYQRFLPDNLGGNSKFASIIVSTRMYHNWELAVLTFETLGLLRSLDGTFVRKPCGSSPHERGCQDSFDVGRNSLVKSYFVSHSRMVGLFSLFYIRCARRFPELYHDLTATDIARLSSAMAARAGRNQACNTVGKSKSGKGLVRSFFSKATKAVKSSLTSSRQCILIHVFVQARGSLSSDTKYSDPDKIVKTSKNVKGTSPKPKASAELDAGPTSLPRSAFSNGAMDSEEDIVRSFSALWGDAEAANAPPDEVVGIDGSVPASFRRLLPLDVVHNFGQYHRLLDPTKGTAYTTGCRGDEPKVARTERLELFLELGNLFVADVNIWLFLEAKKNELLAKAPPSPKSVEDERCASPPYLWSADSNAGFTGATFEPQPLPFSADLIIGSPELPPFFQ